jgi:hypothetical protein
VAILRSREKRWWRNSAWKNETKTKIGPMTPVTNANSEANSPPSGNFMKNEIGQAMSDTQTRKNPIAASVNLSGLVMAFILAT